VARRGAARRGAARRGARRGEKWRHAHRLREPRGRPSATPTAQRTPRTGRAACAHTAPRQRRASPARRGATWLQQRGEARRGHAVERQKPAREGNPRRNGRHKKHDNDAETRQSDGINAALGRGTHRERECTERCTQMSFRESRLLKKIGSPSKKQRFFLRTSSTMRAARALALATSVAVASGVFTRYFIDVRKNCGRARPSSFRQGGPLLPAAASPLVLLLLAGGDDGQVQCCSAGRNAGGVLFPTWAGRRRKQLGFLF